MKMFCKIYVYFFLIISIAYGNTTPVDEKIKDDLVEDYYEIAKHYVSSYKPHAFYNLLQRLPKAYLEPLHYLYTKEFSPYEFLSNYRYQLLYNVQHQYAFQAVISTLYTQKDFTIPQKLCAFMSNGGDLISLWERETYEAPLCSIKQSFIGIGDFWALPNNGETNKKDIPLREYLVYKETVAERPTRDIVFGGISKNELNKIVEELKNRDIHILYHCVKNEKHELFSFSPKEKGLSFIFFTNDFSQIAILTPQTRIAPYRKQKMIQDDRWNYKFSYDSFKLLVSYSYWDLHIGTYQTEKRTYTKPKFVKTFKGDFISSIDWSDSSTLPKIKFFSIPYPKGTTQLKYIENFINFEKGSIYEDNDKTILISVAKNIVRDITLPQGITIIRPMAFNNCKELESVRFLEGLEKVEKDAFINCVMLKQLDFPASLQFLDNPIQNAPKLKTILFRGKPPAYVNLSYLTNKTIQIMYLKEYEEAWKKELINSTWHGFPVECIDGFDGL